MEYSSHFLILGKMWSVRQNKLSKPSKSELLALWKEDFSGNLEGSVCIVSVATRMLVPWAGQEGLRVCGWSSSGHPSVLPAI